MELGLAGRRAVVTGASKGISLAVCRALLDEDVHVTAGARSPGPELPRLAEAGGLDFVAVDLATPDGPGALAAAARRGGPVDILVNNVGAVAPRLDGVAAVTDAQWEATLNLTLMAAVRMVRAVVGGMLEAGRGEIVTIASVNAVLPDPLVVDYGAAKAALVSFSKALSKEVGPAGVRVNTVSPGPVATDIWLGAGGVAEKISGAGGPAPDDVARAAVAGTATHRFTTPAEVADLVILLCSDRAGNVTGADLPIDGGLVQTVR